VFPRATLARSKTGWLLYSATLTFAVVAGEVSSVTRSLAVGAVTLANWVLSAALLTALWGYALQRPIGGERYWRATFWLVLFANVVMLVPVLLSGGTVALVTGGLTLLIIPAYLAAYLYAYRSPHVWTPASP
jgi:hypothetical protein